MDDSLLDEGAMQVVPLLLIALFLDNRTNTPNHAEDSVGG